MISLYAWQTIAQDDIIRNPNSDSFVSGNPLEADTRSVVAVGLVAFVNTNRGFSPNT